MKKMAKTKRGKKVRTKKKASRGITSKKSASVKVSAEKVEKDVERELKREKGTLKLLVVGAVVAIVIIAMFFVFSQRSNNPNVLTPEQIEDINQQLQSNTPTGNVQLTPELIQELKMCGGRFNKDFVKVLAIDSVLYMKEGDGKFFGNFPRYITCNEKDYKYALKIDDDLITTTYLGVVEVSYTKIPEGIMGRGIDVSADDMENGVFIVVAKEDGLLHYRYEPQEGSQFDATSTTPVNREEDQ